MYENESFEFATQELKHKDWLVDLIKCSSIRDVNPIKKSSSFYQQLFDSPQKQIKVPTLFL